MLALEPLVHLTSGAYEAWIAPQAGGRLVRLLWHGSSADVNCVVPITSLNPFASHAWPKQGAFPMLPYGNRLKGAAFDWKERRIQLATPPGQLHGMHGMGHRRAWKMISRAGDRIRLGLSHHLPDDEWPWPFEAIMDYSLSATGLKIAIQLKNTSADAMPASIGWHPYLPLNYLVTDGPASVLVRAKGLHDLGPEGLLYPQLAEDGLAFAPFPIGLEKQKTVVLTHWDGAVFFPLTPDSGLMLRGVDADHLVVHVPAQSGYVCVEPVTALPGALRTYTADQRDMHLSLPPCAVRKMSCELGVESPKQTA